MDNLFSRRILLVNRRYMFSPAVFIILVIFSIFISRELYKIFLNEQRKAK
jgi:hypothetical protein